MSEKSDQFWPAAAQDLPTPVASIDPELLAFLQGVFDVVRQGDAEHLSALLEKGLPVNLCNQNGDSLLMLASYHGHHAATRTLLQFGADPQRRNDSGQIPILGAVFKGDTDMVRLLLDAGADIEGTGPSGRTALMMAAMFGRMDIAQLLLERGANIRARDIHGLSAMDAARVTRASGMVEFLETRLGGEHG